MTIGNATRGAGAVSTDDDRQSTDAIREYASLLATIADAAARELERARLPLHILLENHFGELNENQEEMLAAVRDATDATSDVLLDLKLIADLDLGARRLRLERIKPAELLGAVRPFLLAAARARGVGLRMQIAPLLAAVTGDRALLQKALTTILSESIAASALVTDIEIDVALEGLSLAVRLGHGGIAPPSVRMVAASRVIRAHGGKVTRECDAMLMTIPTASPGTEPSATMRAR